MTPLTVICWKWRPKPGYRSTFGPETVLTLRNMVRRHFPHPHRFVCVTDDPAGLQDVETMADFGDFANLPSPHGGKNPSCYRRLRLFHPDAGQVFGERFVSLDLDAVITGDLTPLWQRSEDVVLWGDNTNPQPGSHYNGSMMLLTAGCRPHVWTGFDPLSSPQEALRNKSWGSDQGWISYCLGPHEAKWGKADGVYSYRNDIHPNQDRLPGDARITLWHGAHDPWGLHGQGLDWVRRHYQ